MNPAYLTLTSIKTMTVHDTNSDSFSTVGSGDGMSTGDVMGAEDEVFMPWQSIYLTFTCYACSCNQNYKILKTVVMPKLLTCIQTVNFNMSSSAVVSIGEGKLVLSLLTNLLQYKGLFNQMSTNNMTDDDSSSVHVECLSCLFTLAAHSIETQSQSKESKEWALSLLDTMSIAVKVIEGDDNVKKGKHVLQALNSYSQNKELTGNNSTSVTSSGDSSGVKRMKKEHESSTPLINLLQSLLTLNQSKQSEYAFTVKVIEKGCDIVSNVFSYFTPEV